MASHRPDNRRGRRWLFVWHRYAGLTLAVFALVLSLSGLMLNHTEALGLDSRYVRSPLILDWYGITAPRRALAFRAGAHWVTRLGERLYLDDRELPGQYASLAGVIALPNALVVVAEDQLLLLTPEGELIERLGPAEGVPANIQRIGLNAANEPVIETEQARYAADQDFLSWRSHPADAATWSAAAEPPATLYERLAERYRGTSLSWERVLLDLHSGRLFGSLGVWVMDAAALLLLLLAATGVWIWLRYKR